MSALNLRAIESCRQITDDHINEAIESRDDTRALFERAVEVAKPRAAGSRLLLIFAKMAGPDCDWLEGALRIELTADGEWTTIESLVDIGAGLKERVFPKTRVEVPLEEFLAAIKKFPQAIAPLTAEAPTRDRLRLVATEAQKKDLEEVAPVKKFKPLSIGDMPVVGVKKRNTQPPPGTLHRPPDVATASASPGSVAKQPAAKRAFAKLALRKSPLTTTGGAAEEIGPTKEFKDASANNPKPMRRPPPFVAPPPPLEDEPQARPEDAKGDVDKGWDDE